MAWGGTGEQRQLLTLSTQLLGLPHPLPFHSPPLPDPTPTLRSVRLPQGPPPHIRGGKEVQNCLASGYTSHRQGGPGF
jgi:hypothetical protein